MLVAAETGVFPYTPPTLARALGQPAPDDDVTYTRHVMAAAGARRAGELAAVQGVARSLGRGAAGLVNAFDPHIVTIGGLGRDILGIAHEQLTAAYSGGLMRFRQSPPPPLLSAQLAGDGLRTRTARRHQR